jgi:tetratricopeptide (TPR) repeat protein
MDVVRLSQLLHQATTLYQNDEYEKALRSYRSLLNQTADTSLLSNSEVADIRLAALRESGQALYVLGRQEEALTRFEQYYQEVGASEQGIDALVLLGRQHTQMGQHHKALGVHREALQLARAVDSLSGRAHAHSGIGSAFRGLGRIEESVPHMARALLLFRELGDNKEEAWVGNQLGISYARLGNIDKAITIFKQALELAREIGVRETAVILSNLGEAYQVLYDMQQAFIYHQEAVAIYDSVDLPSGSADLYRNLGVDLFYLGQSEEGMKYLKAALRISEHAGRPNLHMQALYSLALAEIELGWEDLALTHSVALKVLTETGEATGHLAKALHLEGLCAKLAGEFAKARQVWQQATILAHETGQQMLIWQLHAAQAAIAVSEELAAVHIRIASEIIEQIIYPIEDEKLRQKFLTATPVHAVLSQKQVQ